ncbi:MAG: hypothetical protein RL141_776 [Candidatus Parcubacteria bacterium]|jgi:hypothetical protein
MKDEYEKQLEVGMNVLEMTKSPGWKWLEAKIRDELRITNSELRTMNVEGMTIEKIASEYLQMRANINAYEGVLAMVATALEAKEEAAKALRDS